jgi:hypothetical protein
MGGVGAVLPAVSAIRGKCRPMPRLDRIRIARCVRTRERSVDVTRNYGAGVVNKDEFAFTLEFRVHVNVLCIADPTKLDAWRKQYLSGRVPANTRLESVRWTESDEPVA